VVGSLAGAVALAIVIASATSAQDFIGGLRVSVPGRAGRIGAAPLERPLGEVVVRRGPDRPRLEERRAASGSSQTAL
jgi:hypothetical protein